MRLRLNVFQRLSQKNSALKNCVKENQRRSKRMIMIIMRMRTWLRRILR